MVVRQPGGCGADARLGLDLRELEGLTLGLGFGAAREVPADALAAEPAGESRARSILLNLVNLDQDRTGGAADAGDVGGVRPRASGATWRAIADICITTETELEQMTAALEAGANEYIMKPFTREILVEKLELVGIHS